MHLHLRQGRMLNACAPFSAEYFARAVVMPNTIPSVNTPERLISYRREITEAVDYEPFVPLMTFKLYPGMTPDAVRALADSGAVAGKLYPEGSTTNAEDGVKSWRQIRDALSEMEKTGVVLSIHGEKPDSFVLDREKDYLPELFEIAEAFPSLKIVLEHLSCAESVDAVMKGPQNLAATVTAHHLCITLDELIGGGINPFNFCKPVAKTPADREALQGALLSGSGKFFFGSDSAPHPVQAKLKSSGSAGIFSSPCAMQLLISFFEKNNSLSLLENFTSKFGADFYSLPLNTETITFEKREYAVPTEISGLVPFMAGTVLDWSLKKNS